MHSPHPNDEKIREKFFKSDSFSPIDGARRDIGFCHVGKLVSFQLHKCFQCSQPSVFSMTVVVYTLCNISYAVTGYASVYDFFASSLCLSETNEY